MKTVVNNLIAHALITGLALLLAARLSMGMQEGPPGNPSALELDNTSSQQHGYVRIVDDPALQPETFTLEAWITPAGPGFGSGDSGTIVAKPREGATGTLLGSWSLSWLDTTGQVRAMVVHTFASAGTIFHSEGSIPVDTTAHVAMTFDGETIRVFINGQFDSEAEFPYPSIYYSSQEDVLIGSANYGANFIRPFSGEIDDVRIWNYARSADEIAAQMNCRLDGDEPGLLAYYTFDETAADFSGNGHHGVLTGVTNLVASDLASEPCEHCPADLTGDGGVGVADLLALLACWGPMVPGCEDADLTGDGNVGVADLLQLLSQWGPCP